MADDVTVPGQQTTPTLVPAARSLLSYLAEHKGQVALGIFFLLCTNGFDKAIPWLLKVGVDAFGSDQMDAVRRAAAWVIALALAMAVTRVLSRVLIFNAGRDVEYSLRAELLSKLHVLGAPYVMRRSTGDIMSRATNDLGQIRLLLGFGGLNLVNAAVAYVSAVVLMFAISPRLTLFSLAPYPLFFLVARLFVKRLYKVSQDNQEVLGLLAQRAQEYLSGVRVIRAFTADDAELARFRSVNGAAVERSMALVGLRAMMMPLLMGITALGTLIVLYVGGSMINAGTLTKGDLLAFYAYLAQLVWPTMAAGYMLAIFQRGRASYVRVREVLDAQPEVAEPAKAQPLPVSSQGAAGLRVSNLSFAYDQRPALRDVSFTVQPGQRVAVVGKTGSGKTTLANLLARLLPTPEGCVYVDGVDITRVKLRDLRKAIGYAQQEPFLFSTTVGRNIGFCLEQPDSPEGARQIRWAAEQASVLDELCALPDGLDTVVGERGVQLSGGQKQRVALARALLNRPGMLILDDPLSAVDAKTEAAILDALDRVASERTLVLITNRVAAAARCDRIVVLDEGRVVEQGAHHELLRRGGAYAALCAQQTLERELAAL